MTNVLRVRGWRPPSLPGLSEGERVPATGLVERPGREVDAVRDRPWRRTRAATGSGTRAGGCRGRSRGRRSREARWTASSSASQGANQSAVSPASVRCSAKAASHRAIRGVAASSTPSCAIMWVPGARSVVRTSTPSHVVTRVRDPSTSTRLKPWVGGWSPGDRPATASSTTPPLRLQLVAFDRGQLGAVEQHGEPMRVGARGQPRSPGAHVAHTDDIGVGVGPPRSRAAARGAPGLRRARRARGWADQRSRARGR